MRLIINCDPDLADAAARVLKEEMREWERRYNRVGWGWVFPLGDDARCFVRRIKDGLSLKQTQRTATLANSPNTPNPRPMPIHEP